MTYQHKCIYCEERPASIGRLYCVECDVSREHTEWSTNPITRAAAVVEAQRIIRDHQRRNQV